MMTNVDRRICYLFSLSRNEESFDFKKFLASANTFYYFFSMYTIDPTQITLTPDNDIYCSWENGGNKLSIHFMPDNVISLYHNSLKETIKGNLDSKNIDLIIVKYLKIYKEK